MNRDEKKKRKEKKWRDATSVLSSGVPVGKGGGELGSGGGDRLIQHHPVRILILAAATRKQ